MYVHKIGGGDVTGLVLLAIRGVFLQRCTLTHRSDRARTLVHLFPLPPLAPLCLLSRSLALALARSPFAPLCPCLVVHTQVKLEAVDDDGPETEPKEAPKKELSPENLLLSASLAGDTSTVRICYVCA